MLNQPERTQTFSLNTGGSNPRYLSQRDWQNAQNEIFDRMLKAVAEYETLGFDVKIEIKPSQVDNEFRDGGYYGQGNWH